VDDIEKADRLSRRRARMLPALAAIFIAQQASFFTAAIEEGGRTVDHVKIGAWLILSIVLLLALTTGGFWLQPRRVRALLDDEVTRANRAEAVKTGFIATMLAAFAVYGLTMVEAVAAPEAIHLIVSIGIAAALLRFGFLERRAHRHG
jgi:heme/copper-type cytochrome/quinol oxidase subunit 2